MGYVSDEPECNNERPPFPSKSSLLNSHACGRATSRATGRDVHTSMMLGEASFSANSEGSGEAGITKGTGSCMRNPSACVLSMLLGRKGGEFAEGGDSIIQSWSSASMFVTIC